MKILQKDRVMKRLFDHLIKALNAKLKVYTPYFMGITQALFARSFV